MDRFPIPDVLECMRFVIEAPHKSQRIVRDYEFDFYLGAEREIYIDGVYYHISEGCLVFRKPGEVVVGYGDYDMYMLTLDFSNTRIKDLKSYYRSADTPQQEPCSLDVINNIPSVFIPERQAEIRELYERLSDCSPPNIVNRELQGEYIAEFLFLVLAEAYKYNRLHAENFDGGSYVKRACNYINDRYNEQITIEDIANYLSLNKNYLIRLFRAELKTTPHRYILETRLLRARQLLVHSDYSVQQVALLCGFNTPSYFIKSFKTRFGKTPVAYRNGFLDIKGIDAYSDRLGF